MKQRQLGRLGPNVSAVGLGCYPMSGVYGLVSDADGIATIHLALDFGITLLDTADVYGHGHNEALIRRAIRGRRDQVVLATKFGNVGAAGGQRMAINGQPKYVRQACESSLRRLGVDVIDLYQLHRVDPDTPIEETIGALGELVQDGKIRYIGMSEAHPIDLRRAAATHPITSLQSEYSLFERSVEGEVLEVCDELGIGFLPFAPLMRGLLSGRLTPERDLDTGDIRSATDRFPRVAPRHIAANADLVGVVREVANEHEASAAQVALAWLLSRRPWIVPIPGAKRPADVRDNAHAPEVQLTPEDYVRLEGLADRVQGERHTSRKPSSERVSPPQRR